MTHTNFLSTNPLIKDCSNEQQRDPEEVEYNEHA